MSPALLTCSGVDVAYDKVQVLFGVDMEVEEGEIVALLGTNGAGKSTLLKAISGLVEPVGGTILFDGEDITRADPVHAAKLGIVQVPGGKAVFPTLTVAERSPPPSCRTMIDPGRRCGSTPRRIRPGVVPRRQSRPSSKSSRGDRRARRGRRFPPRARRASPDRSAASSPTPS